MWKASKMKWSPGVLLEGRVRFFTGNLTGKLGMKGMSNSGLGMFKG